MIASMHMPKDVLQATIQDLSIDDESRVTIAQKGSSICKNDKRNRSITFKRFLLIR